MCSIRRAIASPDGLQRVRSDRTTAGISFQERTARNRGERNPPPGLSFPNQPSGGRVPHRTEAGSCRPAQGVSSNPLPTLPIRPPTFSPAAVSLLPGSGESADDRTTPKMKERATPRDRPSPGSGCDPSPAGAKGGPSLTSNRRCALGRTPVHRLPTSGEDRRESPIGGGGSAPSGTGPGRKGRFPVPAARFPHTPLLPRGTEETHPSLSAESIRSRK